MYTYRYRYTQISISSALSYPPHTYLLHSPTHLTPISHSPTHRTLRNAPALIHTAQQGPGARITRCRAQPDTHSA